MSQRIPFGYYPFPEVSTRSEQIAHEVDEPDVSDWTFRRPILSRMPERFAVPLAYRYKEIHLAIGRQAGNLYLHDVNDDLSSLALTLSSSYDDVVNQAKKIAEYCIYHRRTFQNEKNAYEYLKKRIRKRYRISLPSLHQVQGKLSPVSVTVTHTDTVTDTDTENFDRKFPVTVTVTGILERLCTESWWRKTLGRTLVRDVEKHAIGLGIVHRHAEIYVSDESVKRRRQQIQRNKRAMQNCYMVNELGEELTLQDCIEHSLANPSNRRAELMVRIRGTEDLSIELGHIAYLYTITCPSRMHARHSESGKSNPKYDGTNPAQAQKYLSVMWQQIRSKLKRDGLTYYGFRVVEPHHDGTPHWHLLLFMEKQHAKAIGQVLRDYALRDSGNEAGAQKRRFTAVKINPKKGSATGYIAKYISKNIDGFGMDDDLYGYDAKDAAKRISAWASVWGIRQFQQIGGPPVTLYRELRRIRGNDLQGLLLEAWGAADQADWKTFIKLMGGPIATQKECPLDIARQWSDEPNRYYESKGFKIIGVQWQSVILSTRIHTWTKHSKHIEKIAVRALPMAPLYNALERHPPIGTPPNETLAIETPLEVSKGPENAILKIGVLGALAPLEFCQ